MLEAGANTASDAAQDASAAQERDAAEPAASERELIGEAGEAAPDAVPAPLPAPPLGETTEQVPSASALQQTPGQTSADSQAIEVQVEARVVDEGRRLANSSAAVHVVDTSEAQAQPSDLGALLSRQQGINLQRSGGLGAQTRLTLQGLGEDQIRFYVDGVPLAYTGLPESIAFIPLDLVTRAEIYRGVVPIVFGGDTLAGAIHLVTPAPQLGTHGSASLTVGAFDTQRLALRAQHADAKSGLYAAFSGFLDRARNDYRMRDVPVAQRNGKKEPRDVYRMHDGYRANYGQLELGVLDRPYAKRLSVRGFASSYGKEINHDVLMNNAYGEVLARRRAQGAMVFYEQPLTRKAALDVKLGYAHRTRQLRDLSDCSYDWYHNCVSSLPNGGEIWGLAANRKTEEHDLFLRAQLALRFSRLLQFRVSAAPTIIKSRSQDIAVTPGIPDLFDQNRRLWGLTLGVEHELDAWAGRLENVLFVKDYLQDMRADATATQGIISHDKTHHRVGVGDALRVRLHEQLIAKLSYELGTRLPSGDEVFGDGGLIDPNLRLVPERSHNANLELRWQYQGTRGGSGFLSASTFFRQVKDFIFLLPGPMISQYQNLADARGKGVEGQGRYVSPGEYVTLAGSITWQDLRNQATRGPFAMFEGKRVPNRPYLFGNLSITGMLKGVAVEGDALTLTFRESYVEEFYRAFEVPRAQNRQAVPAQWVSSLLLTYELTRAARSISGSLELNNLTDAKVFDFVGVQRPGRYGLAKLMIRM